MIFFNLPLAVLLRLEIHCVIDISSTRTDAPSVVGSKPQYLGQDRQVLQKIDGLHLLFRTFQRPRATPEVFGRNPRTGQ